MVLVGNINDVTLGVGSGDEEVDEVEEVQERESSSSNVNDMKAMMESMQNFLNKSGCAFDAMASSVSGKKRRCKSDDGEEEQIKSMPKLVRLENHLLEDDAHTVLDWKVRFSIRPYNGGDWKLYWSKRPIKDEPVLEDLNLSHLTKSPINPNVIAKVHDRGCQTTAKQWLSSNYSVEEKGGKIRATDDKTAGAFVLSYEEPKGVWEAVDAVHNYTMVLGQVRPEDWSGRLLLNVLHGCRMFSHPKFNDKSQREMIMDFFDQVLKQNAMKGRCKKPPMEETEMMEMAKALLYRRGVEGFSTFVATEPYSRSSAKMGGGGVNAFGNVGGNFGGGGGARGRGAHPGRGRQAGPPGPGYGGRVTLSGKSVEEKLALCCGDFNSKGCTRPQCIYMHKCSFVDRTNDRICFASHSKAQH